MRDYSIKWKAYEYEHSPRSQDWFWAVGIITVAIAVTSIILGNFLFALLVIIAAFALSIYAIREPKYVEFEIRQRGVRLDTIFYPYTTLESFWIEGVHEEEEPNLLIIKSRKLLMPFIIAPLSEDVDKFELRDYLLDHLDEEEMPEPVSHKIMHMLGF